MLVLKEFNDKLGYETLTKVYSVSLLVSMIEDDQQAKLSKRDVRQLENLLFKHGKVMVIINNREVTLYDDSFKE